MGLNLKLMDLLVYNSRSRSCSSSSNSSCTSSSSSSSSSSNVGGGSTGTSTSRVSVCIRSIFYSEIVVYFGKYYVYVKIVGRNSKISQLRHVFNN